MTSTRTLAMFPLSECQLELCDYITDRGSTGTKAILYLLFDETGSQHQIISIRLTIMHSTFENIQVKYAICIEFVANKTPTPKYLLFL